MAINKTKWSGLIVDPRRSYIMGTGRILLAYKNVRELRDLGWDLPTVRRFKARQKKLERMMAGDKPEREPDGAA